MTPQSDDCSVGRMFYLWILLAFKIILIPPGCYMGVLATATFLSGASLLRIRISWNHWSLNIASIVRGASTTCSLVVGYRSLCNALKRRSKVVEKVLRVHSALAIATVPRAVECQEKMWLPALTTQVLRCNWVFRFKHLIAWLQALTGS